MFISNALLNKAKETIYIIKFEIDRVVNKNNQL